MKTCTSVFLLCSLLISFCLQAQQPAIQWQKNYGGSGEEGLYNVNVLSLNGNGFIVAGGATSNNGNVTGNHGMADYWVLRIDSVGAILWQKCFGGSSEDFPNALIPVSDTSFLVAGSSQSYDGNVSSNFGFTDYWIIQVDINGNLMWEKSLGGGYYDDALCAVKTEGAGFMISGSCSSNDDEVTDHHEVEGFIDPWMAQVNESGNFTSGISYGNDENDQAFAIATTINNGFVICGDRDVFSDGWDFFISKQDSDHVVIWSKTFGGSENDMAYSIIPTPDNGFLVTGSTSSNDFDVTGNHGGSDVWVIKLDSAGNIIWQHCYGGAHDETGRMIRPTADGNYIITGSTGSNNSDVSGNHGQTDVWLFKIDANGNLLWQFCLGGSRDDEAFQIAELMDHSFILSAYTKSNDGDVSGNNGIDDFWIVKLGKDCLPVTSNFSLVEMNNTISFADSSVNSNKWYWTFGDGTTDSSQNPLHTYSLPGSYEVCLTASNDCSVDTFCNSISVIATSASAIPANNFFEVIPNVTSSSTTISFTFNKMTNVQISLHNAQGKKLKTILSGNVASGMYHLFLDCGELTAGVYFINLISANGAGCKRLVVY